MISRQGVVNGCIIIVCTIQLMLILYTSNLLKHTHYNAIKPYTQQHQLLSYPLQQPIPGFAVIQDVYIDPFSQLFIYANVNQSQFKANSVGIVRGMTSSGMNSKGISIIHPIWKAIHRDLSFSESQNVPQVDDGIVLMFSEDLGPFLEWYFHFIEYIYAMWTLLGEFGLHNARVKYIVFPYSGFDLSDTNDWPGRPPVFMNKQVLEALWPTARILSEAEFIQTFQALARKPFMLSGNRLVKISSLVVVDRHSTIASGLVTKLNKMNADILNYIRFHHQSLQTRLLNSLLGDRQVHNTSSAKAKVILVDRFGGLRNMARSILQILLEALKKRENFDVEVVAFEKLEFREQVKKSAQADIMLGIHGNGLTHSMWLKPGSLLVEIFPKESFQADYQFMAECGSLKHMAWDEATGLIRFASNMFSSLLGPSSAFSMSNLQIRSENIRNDVVSLDCEELVNHIEKAFSGIYAK